MLQEQTSSSRSRWRSSDDALKALNARLDAADQAAQKRFADQELLIKKLGRPMSAPFVSARRTPTRGYASSATKSMRYARPSPRCRRCFRRLPRHRRPTRARSIPERRVRRRRRPGLERPPPSTVGLSPSRMLDIAKSDYFSGSYPSAITGFEALLRTFPTSEAAAEAQFCSARPTRSRNATPKPSTPTLRRFRSTRDRCGCRRRTTSAARPRNRSAHPTRRGPRTNC